MLVYVIKYRLKKWIILHRTIWCFCFAIATDKLIDIITTWDYPINDPLLNRNLYIYETIHVLRNQNFGFSVLWLRNTWMVPIQYSNFLFFWHSFQPIQKCFSIHVIARFQWLTKKDPYFQLTHIKVSMRAYLEIFSSFDSIKKV